MKKGFLANNPRIRPIPTPGMDANHHTPSRYTDMKRFALRHGVPLSSVFYDAYNRLNSTKWEERYG